MMEKTLQRAGVAAVLVLAGCGVLAPKYPSFSAVSYRLEGVASAADRGPPVPTTIFRNGENMRVETTLPYYGRVVIVYDTITKAPYVLNPTGAPPPSVITTTTTAVRPALPSVTAPPGAAAVTPPPFGGVAVLVDPANAPQPMETTWAALGAESTESVGGCTVAGVHGHEWRPKHETEGVHRTACITNDGIVLRVRENGRTLFEATRLMRGAQSARLFGVPAGYQLIDPNHVGGPAQETVAMAGPPSPVIPPR